MDSMTPSFPGGTNALRDRYVAARFPGLLSSAADLASTDDVIKAARLLFEDERGEDALELLDLAIDEDPAVAAPWLARLEILFLLRDADRFVATAQAFHAEHPASGVWPDVQRLGRALAPHEPAFRGNAADRPHDRYGPWPDLPNWIRAPWDLTAEVAAAEFRRAMLGEPSANRRLDA